jgi:hypothetical protein
MNKGSEPSFELLHLISALLERFILIQKKCNLDAQQIYLLAYFKSHGKINRRGQRVLLRSNITDILKEVFKCSDNKVSGWVTKLSAGKFLGEITLSKDEKAELFSMRKGRDKALFIRKEGIAKVAFFVRELEKLRHEITQQNSKLLLPPRVEEYGMIATALRFFLDQFPDSNE